MFEIGKVWSASSHDVSVQNWPLSIFVLPRIIPLLLMIAATYVCILQVASYFEYQGGCDWFGYSRQAQLFQERGSVSGLNTAITDSVTRYVIEKVKSLNVPGPVWYHAIGPHCHNYKPDTDQLVLQYPPGTGWLFSFFREGVQARLAFIFWMLTALAICLWNAIDECSPVIPALASLLYLFCLFAMWYFLNDWSIPGSIVSAVLAAYCVGTAYRPQSLYRYLLWIALSGFALGLSAKALFREGRRQLIVDDDCMRLMIDQLKKDNHWNFRLVGQLFGSDVFQIEGKSPSGE